MEAHVDSMRFDGRVAIITGAGGNPGVGRAHARLLAERGAKVVVNDLGVGPDGRGSKPANAEDVAAEIRAAGGEAIADLHSVASEEGAGAVVQTALDAWGRVDILVNNAGVGVVATFAEITSEDIRTLTGVHLMGGLWMCRAAWPHMIAGRYGRIVNTTSGGMYGSEGLSVYGAAKFGMYGLTRGLAVEGAAHNILVNAMSPGAYTNSLDPFYTIEDPAAKEAFIQALKPELVSPVVAYLVHEDCQISGMLFDVGGGSVTSTFLCASPGMVNAELTIEDVRDNLETILDRSHLRVLTDPSNPVGEPNEMASILVRKPYTPV
jgi:NAD(P)-dependent dehydrogenase (short-subunit alcohol dehydrogenase family)